MGTTNFNKQTVADIAFLKSILPKTYTVGESKKLGSIHCVSETGIVKQEYQDERGHWITDAEDKIAWQSLFLTIKAHFGDRFQEVYHNTCTNHVDFTIYLKDHQ